MTATISENDSVDGGPSRRRHRLAAALALIAMVLMGAAGSGLWPVPSARAEAVDPRSDGAPETLLEDKQLGELRAAAEEGTADDRFRLALELFKFKQDEKDAEAFALLKAAVEERHIRSITLLAVCYGDGRGVEEDVAEAVALLKRAANLGQSEAQLILGMLLQDGRGMAKDPEAAIAWLRRSMNQGNPNAMIVLSQSHVEGLGVDEDPEAALELAVQASAEGYSRGLMQLARLHAGGIGTEADLEQAMELLAEAGDNPWAMNNLAWLLATGPDPDLHDGRKAIRIMREVLDGLTSDDAWVATDTLAAAHARNGNNKAAVQTQQSAIGQFEQWRAEHVDAESEDDDEWTRERHRLVDEAAERLQRRLTIYQDGKAVRENPASEEFEPDEVHQQPAGEESESAEQPEPDAGAATEEPESMEPTEDEEVEKLPRRSRAADDSETPGKLRNFPRGGSPSDDEDDEPEERSRILI